MTLHGDAGKSTRVRFPCTGDWGFKTEGWKYAAVQLPACAKGTHTLEVRSLADKNNVNFDGFYLSAEVALWHLRLGETKEAWRILQAMVDRASSTVCWYEEIGHQPPVAYGDPADVWAAAETVFLTRQLLLAEQARKMKNK